MVFFDGSRLVELGQNLFAEQVQRAHNFIAGGVTGQDHEEKLVHAQIRPALHAAADRVNVAPDDQAVVDQVVVRSLEDRLAYSRPPSRRQLALVVLTDVTAEPDFL